jgi:mannose-6-phosphate isomerase-like protein (cupin superfamily)
LLYGNQPVSFAIHSKKRTNDMEHVIDWRSHAGSVVEKFFKSTLWQGGHLMVGINCLETNQVQKVHAHEGADKVYFVLEGRGLFTIDEQQVEAGAGMLVVAPAGKPHGVSNVGTERLSLLVTIAPFSK